MKKITILSLFSILILVLFLKGNPELISFEKTYQSFIKGNENVLNQSVDSNERKVGDALPLLQKQKAPPLNGDNNASATSDNAQEVINTSQAVETNPRSKNAQQVISSIPPSFEIAQINSKTTSRALEISPRAANANPNRANTSAEQITEAKGLNVETIVPTGGRLPAAIVDSSANLTEPQAEVLDRISEEFLDSAVTNNVGVDDLKKNKAAEKKWSQSLMEANERYRSLYGVDAYNARTIQAAKEALADRP
jgi:hypothetical protein